MLLRLLLSTCLPLFLIKGETYRVKGSYVLMFLQISWVQADNSTGQKASC